MLAKIALFVEINCPSRQGFSQVAFPLPTRAYGARFSREMVVFVWRWKRHTNTTISLKNGSLASHFKQKKDF